MYVYFVLIFGCLMSLEGSASARGLDVVPEVAPEHARVLADQISALLSDNIRLENYYKASRALCDQSLSDHNVLEQQARNIELAIAGLLAVAGIDSNDSIRVEPCVSVQRSNSFSAKKSELPAVMEGNSIVQSRPTHRRSDSGPFPSQESFSFRRSGSWRAGPVYHFNNQLKKAMEERDKLYQACEKLQECQESLAERQRALVNRQAVQIVNLNRLVGKSDNKATNRAVAESASAPRMIVIKRHSRNSSATTLPALSPVAGGGVSGSSDVVQ